jgi:hypothetical protein
MAGNLEQNLINHVALVLDASGSMSRHQSQLIKVADEQIAYLAKKSQEMDQETRVTIYSFDNNVRCLVYDKDVLRLPSIKELYRIGGATALIEATLKSLDDLAHTWEGYGDHSFLQFVLTDGEENASGGSWHTQNPGARKQWVDKLSTRLAALKDNWTVAVMVPNQLAKREAISFGFPKDNIAVWDTDSDRGVEEAVSVIRTATDSYMAGRASGVRGTRAVFIGANVDAAAVKQVLTPLAHTAYEIVPVTKTEKAFEKFDRPTKAFPKGKPLGWFVRIDDFLNKVHPPFFVGKGYYQLFSGDARRSEKVQGNKAIAVMDNKTHQIYVGPQARQIVGLRDQDEVVKPQKGSQYTIFVKSTSDNRHLPCGTELLIMK